MTINTISTRTEQINTNNTRVDFMFNSLFNIPTNNREDRNINFDIIEARNKSNENIYSEHEHILRRCLLN